MWFGFSAYFSESASTDFSNLTTGFCALEEANNAFVCNSPSLMLTSSSSCQRIARIHQYCCMAKLFHHSEWHLREAVQVIPRSTQWRGKKKRGRENWILQAPQSIHTCLTDGQFDWRMDQFNFWQEAWLTLKRWSYLLLWTLDLEYFLALRTSLAPQDPPSQTAC